MAEDKLYDFQPFEEQIDKQKIPPISTFAKPTGYENGPMQTAPNSALDMVPVPSGYPHYQSQRVIYKNGGYSQAPNPAAFYVVAAAGNQSVVYPATSGASTSTPSQSNQSLQSNMAVPHMLNNNGSGLETPTSGTLPPTPPVSADEKDNNNEDPDHNKTAALARLLSQGKDPMGRVPHGGYPPHQMQAPHHFMPPTPHMSSAPGPMSPIGGDHMSGYSRSRAPSKRRSMKKPVSDEMKDDKYFERRKKNNLAAKRSRDARKMREEDVARRASYLQKENDALKTQMETLREEAYALRQLLAQKSS